MTTFFVIQKSKGTVREFDEARTVAAVMLGRLTTDYIIVKSDVTGDRVVPMVPECGQLERNCIDA